MNGGSAIATGSQGCIFSPRLIENVQNNRIIATENNTNTTQISKVFYDKNTFITEFKCIKGSNYM